MGLQTPIVEQALGFDESSSKSGNIPSQSWARDQHCHDNVTIFSGQQIVAYYISLFIVATSFRHKGLTIFLTFACHYRVIALCTSQSSKIVACSKFITELSLTAWHCITRLCMIFVSGGHLYSLLLKSSFCQPHLLCKEETSKVTRCEIPASDVCTVQ